MDDGNLDGLEGCCCEGCGAVIELEYDTVALALPGGEFWHRSCWRGYARRFGDTRVPLRVYRYGETSGGSAHAAPSSRL